LCARITGHRAVLASFSLFAALCTLWAFLHFFPDFIFGPYAKTNPILEVIFFPNIREAVPFTKAWQDLWDSFAQNPKNALGGALYYAATRLFVPLVGILTCLYALFRKGFSLRQRRVWMLYALYSISFTLLAFCWEIRVITYAQLFSITPFTWIMLRYLFSLSKNYSGRTLYMWECLTVLSFTLFPVILVPSIIGQSKFMPDMMFYLGKGVDLPCMNRNGIIGELQAIEKQDKKIVTVMAPMDYTPEFMFYTGHHYIAAPYHRNDRGIIDSALFFRSTQDDAPARTIAKRLNLDYVILCKAAQFQSSFDTHSNANSIGINRQNNKLEKVASEEQVRNGTLALRLAKDRVPHWLEPVPIILENYFGFFRVKKELLGQPTKFEKKN
jgi:hypothetical protein